MFCVNCGKYNPDKEEKCKYCGGKLSNNVEYRTAHKRFGVVLEDKKSAGLLWALFFGVLATIIGVLVYYDEPEKRSSFIKGALQGFLINFIISTVAIIIILSKVVKFLIQVGAL